MSSATDTHSTALAGELLNAFDAINGSHPGFRPTHAKGILLAGVFTASPAATTITHAPHVQRSSTPVTVRFSDFGGIPAVPDSDPNASPRGMAIRFHLAEHVHTDIVAHSVDGFPTQTAEEFLQFLQALGASGPGVTKPTPVEKFLATHPSALEFVQAPKPVPVSFSRESFFAVSAYRFVNQAGARQHGRYRIRPDGPNEHLDAESAAKQGPNFLFDEMRERLAKGPARMRIAVQLAAENDTVNDSTVHWPKDRPEVEFGTLELTSVVPDNAVEQRHIIFDPIPRVNGIEASEDPLLEPRATLYLMSGRRRRAEGAG